MNRLSTNVLPLPLELIPAVELVPMEFETSILFDAPAWMPVPLWLQVLLAMTWALMPLMLAPLPSRMPPATDTLVAPEETAINGTVTDEFAALMVAPLAMRHSCEPSTIPALLTE